MLNINDVDIAAIASTVPAAKISNFDFADSFGEIEVKKIIKNIGVETRHIASVTQTTSDFCFLGFSLYIFLLIDSLLDSWIGLGAAFSPLDSESFALPSAAFAPPSELAALVRDLHFVFTACLPLRKVR